MKNNSNDCSNCEYLKAEIERLKEKVGYLQVENKAFEVNLAAAENENETLRKKIIELVKKQHQ